jgi:hypothetical protein
MIGWCGNMRLIKKFWNSLNNCVLKLCHIAFQAQKIWLWALKCVERYVIFIGLVLNLNPNVNSWYKYNTHFHHYFSFWDLQSCQTSIG